MRFFYLSLFIVFSLLPSDILAESYPEIVFSNSSLAGSYAKSKVRYSGESWVQNVKQKVPVTDSIFFTPSNSLSLRYSSSKSGDWSVDILNQQGKVPYLIKQDDVLTFKLYVQSAATNKKMLPKIAVLQNGQVTTAIPLSKYITDFATDMWINVEIPVKAIHTLKYQNPIEAIRFMQGENDANLHQLFVDQIEFLPLNPPSIKLSSAAMLSQIKATDKCVELNWQLPLNESIRFVKVYRSVDNQKFDPIAVYPVYKQKGLDIVPDYNQKYYYKIAWVDYDYAESPFSTSKEVQVARSADEDLVRMVQAAHIHYFVENYDVNSGLYLPVKNIHNTIVSVKETGYAILALIVGVENKTVQRQALYSRLNRIVDFLDKAQQHAGVFSAYYDGRTGLPFYLEDKSEYDLRATATLLEGLIVAKSYFNGAAEKPLADKISRLINQVNWRKWTLTTDQNVLVDTWSNVDSSFYANPIGGFNESLNVYILAQTGNYPLSLDSYTEGYGFYRTKIDATPIPSKEGLGIKVLDSLYLLLDEYRQDSLTAHEYSTRAIRKDTLLYGKRLQVAGPDLSLMTPIRMFMTINPKGKKDQFADYSKEIADFTLAYKRRDNESTLDVNYTDLWGVEHFGDSLAGTRINPALSVATMAFQYEVGQKALKELYKQYGDVLLTETGFKAWIDVNNHAISDSYYALNQAAVAVMIENAKSGLIWRLYEQAPEIQPVLKKIYAAK